ncbi:MAG: SRPBCC domain-containing protein [Bryobacteraceae bacterium]|nr:SRPBCC domain-containing protein [Bryobacteraceae bacterium]
MRSGGVRFEVRIEAMSEPNLFRWTWHAGMPDQSVDYSKEPTTEVTSRLEPKDGGTLVTVTETGFDLLSLSRRAVVFAGNQSKRNKKNRRLGWLRGDFSGEQCPSKRHT